MSEKPLTYKESFPVYRSDGDHLGYVKPGALLRYAQQIATKHAEAVGLTDDVYATTHTAYVLAKSALHINRMPRVDEILNLVTQPECCKRAVNKRITHFYDAAGKEAAVMDSRWVLIDTEKRTILRKHPAEFDDCWAEDVPLELPMKMKKAVPAECTLLGTRTASYSLCDMNGHLNNTRYADIICDALPWEIWEQGIVQDLVIFYHREVPLGNDFYLFRAQTGEKRFYFNGERDGKSAFEAQITFKTL